MTTRLNDLQDRTSDCDPAASARRGHHGGVPGAGRLSAPIPAERVRSRPPLCDLPKTARIWQDPRTKEGRASLAGQGGPDEVAMLKRKLGSYGYAGQYQQRPRPRGGGIFKQIVVALLDVQDDRPAAGAGAPAGWHHAARSRRSILPDEFDRQLQRGTWPSRTCRPRITWPAACGARRGGPLPARSGARAHGLSRDAGRPSRSDDARSGPKPTSSWSRTRPTGRR